MFDSCYALERVTIPDSVTSIGEGAFSGCGSLKSVTIPDSVTSIDDGAFESGSALTLTVTRGSWAEKWCKENGMSYAYPDSLDWLNQ